MSLPRVPVSALHLGVLTAIALSITLSAWAYGSGDLWSYFGNDVPEGQLVYVLSKAFALAGIVLLWIQLLVGLLIASRGTVAPHISLQWHQQIGTVVLILLLLHWGAFVTGVSMRLDHFARDYVTPTFSHGYYRTIVSLGMLSIIAMVLATLAALVRRHFKYWRVVHTFAAIGGVGGAIHSWLIGSETRMGTVKWLYVFMLVTLACALLWRLAWGLRRGSSPRAAEA
jgi:DMSO/TMAO reductase YedYZ heme-binding membrane subunit